VLLPYLMTVKMLKGINLVTVKVDLVVKSC